MQGGGGAFGGNTSSYGNGGAQFGNQFGAGAHPNAAAASYAGVCGWVGSIMRVWVWVLVGEVEVLLCLCDTLHMIHRVLIKLPLPLTPSQRQVQQLQM